MKYKMTVEPTVENYSKGNNVYKCVQTLGNIGPHQYAIWTIECNTYPWHIVEWGDLSVNGDVHDEKDIENGKSWISSFNRGCQMAAHGSDNIDGFEEIVDMLDELLVEYNKEEASRFARFVMEYTTIP